jgi:hypothetical protein
VHRTQHSQIHKTSCISRLGLTAASSFALPSLLRASSQSSTYACSVVIQRSILQPQARHPAVSPWLIKTQMQLPAQLLMLLCTPIPHGTQYLPLTEHMLLREDGEFRVRTSSRWSEMSSCRAQARLSSSKIGDVSACRFTPASPGIDASRGCHLVRVCLWWHTVRRRS